MKCPYNYVINKLKIGLPPLTARIAALPVDERGYPIPFFVAVIEGKPDFRVASTIAYAECINNNLCWVCGQKLGRHKAFLVGPMCGINRTSSEPPSHLDCAEWSVKGCPFLSKPNMVRNEHDLPVEKKPFGGVSIDRNPGVMLIWVTNSFKVYRPKQTHGTLINIGDPTALSFWREGRKATRAEIMESIDSGYPLLQSVCQSLDEMEELAKARERFVATIPNE